MAFVPVQTRVLTVDPHRPDPAAVRDAAAVIRAGGLVAFPTETVYGLGANALDETAARRIFEAKNRTPTNPVIVHVADVAAARPLVEDWPDVADRLARNFWPGPLTLILRKSPQVASIVAAGGTTVGIRIPKHPVALALLREAGVPIAAPSANLSTQVSPTRPEHVLAGLNGRVDLVLAAGATEGGLESTVLDVTHTPPRILRPGLVNPAQLRAAIGDVEVPPIGHTVEYDADEPARSPGLLERHYAPVARLVVAPDEGESTVRDLLRAKRRVGWLSFEGGTILNDAQCVQLLLPARADAYAREFYNALHELDQAGVDWIVVSRPPIEEAWLAIHDRLRRAGVSESSA